MWIKVIWITLYDEEHPTTHVVVAAVSTQNLARIGCTKYDVGSWNIIPCHTMLVAIF